MVVVVDTNIETSIHWNNRYMVLLLGGMVLYLHLVACLIWQALHVLSSARGVFGGLNYFRKIGACEKQGGACDFLSFLRFLSLPPPIYEVQRVHFIYFLVSVLLFPPVWQWFLLKCVELKWQRLICRVCAFYPVCGSGSACFLIMRYRENNSSSCLQVVLMK